MSEKTFILPDQMDKQDHSPRRVGIEIEMTGIDLAMIACQCNIAYGGRIREISPYEFFIEHTEIGDIQVELDFRYLKRIGRDKYGSDVSQQQYSELEHYASDALAALSKNIVPCELVCPPLSMTRLEELNVIVQRLRQHNAKGTGYSILYAFGVHLNPELPDLNETTILNYLKSFLCLQDWLIESEGVSLTRKLSPFIDKFSAKYIKRVLDPDYKPELPQLIDDYLYFNPTRNRTLDMLPLFAYLDEDRVRAAIGDEKLNKRPTLHYRLPNSDIDNPHWGLWQCWNRWMQVEYLANDADRLLSVCQHYMKTHQQFFQDLLTPWKDQVRQWLIHR